MSIGAVLVVPVTRTEDKYICMPDPTGICRSFLPYFVIQLLCVLDYKHTGYWTTVRGYSEYHTIHVLYSEYSILYCMHAL